MHDHVHASHSHSPVAHAAAPDRHGAVLVAPSGVSVLLMSVPVRLGVAAGLVLVLWALVAWALV
ncbi:MAG: hypothetical protein ACRCS5_08990 [Sphingomonas sp.]|uniref:hypothetical protein n=1 Tax=Sphingomonas sp. TaxID=28214 RepID=UPI003F32855B